MVKILHDSDADASVLNGTTYYYLVSATNSAGEGPDSAEANATPVLSVWPILALTQNGILSWTGSSTLQSATNVAGPYLDVPGATSPYTNDTGAQPQQFFRLRN